MTITLYQLREHSDLGSGVKTFTQGGQVVYSGSVWESIAAVETDPIVKAITGIVKSDGTNITAAVAGDFPTLNQNTTGSAANISGGLGGQILYQSAAGVNDKIG